MELITKCKFYEFELHIYKYSNKGFIIIWYKNGIEVDRKLANVFSEKIGNINEEVEREYN